MQQGHSSPFNSSIYRGPVQYPEINIKIKNKIRVLYVPRYVPIGIYMCVCTGGGDEHGDKGLGVSD